MECHYRLAFIRLLSSLEITYFELESTSESIYLFEGFKTIF